MRKGGAGQALILVLIILAIAAMVATPALGLTSTALKSSQIATQKVKELYAAQAAQEYVMWKLLYDGLGANFTQSGDNVTLQLNLCDMPVDISIIMRAVAGTEEIILATEHVIRPTKTVVPDAHSYGYETYTYTINLEQVSSDTSQGLDAIYDILPSGFDSTAYQQGSSYLRVDGGPWELIPNPEVVYDYGLLRLRWPASGSFTSPIRDFMPGQVKELKFQVYGRLANDQVHYNWVILKPWNTLSGAQAPITVGNPSTISSSNGVLVVGKTSEPEIIPVGVETTVTYTVSMTNLDATTYDIERITDFLPPGFIYCSVDEGCDPPSGITDTEPSLHFENVNDVYRWRLRWTFEEKEREIQPGETVTLTFHATTAGEVSGSHYNEVVIWTRARPPDAFADVLKDIDVFPAEYSTAYSWNTGDVIVPHYDSQGQVGSTTINANLSLTLDGIVFRSWQVE